MLRSGRSAFWYFLALVIGVMTGLGAVAFRALIGLVHNVFYKSTLTFAYDANIMEGPSPFGVCISVSPLIGGLPGRRVPWPPGRSA